MYDLRMLHHFQHSFCANIMVMKQCAVKCMFDGPRNARISNEIKYMLSKDDS